MVEDTNRNFRRFTSEDLVDQGPKGRKVAKKRRRLVNEENGNPNVHVTTTNRFPNLTPFSTGSTPGRTDLHFPARGVLRSPLSEITTSSTNNVTKQCPNTSAMLFPTQMLQQSSKSINLCRGEEDVIGFVKFDDPEINHFVNKFGLPQKQFKFEITDGRTTVKVTFWDALAELLEKSLTDELEVPLIMIIASARVGCWQEEIDISNVPATMFYLNYPHHSVHEMRELASQPMFADLFLRSHNSNILKLYSATDIQHFGTEYVESQVMCELKIMYVEPTEKWYIYICTSCYREIENDNGSFKCIICARNVPYPDKKFQIFTVCSDESGQIEVMLTDREIRKIFSLNVFEVETLPRGENNFPLLLRTMEKQDYTLKILIKQANVDKLIKYYQTTDIFFGKYGDDNEEDVQNTPGTSSSGKEIQGSSSSYHLDGLSQLNFRSPSLH
ncbi:hypothetical protein POM88_008730 [Heracleum sosnowskyi]|uniref:Replication factor A C-terminal domain-containing protein n=1 Tax=Heracleum sosnowskyi TaxID=360622 RepID=A0AAD8N7J7_9APIA|nr:hypothetical protein POM88_008730 [Heracleum sosnowskyi]